MWFVFLAAGLALLVASGLYLRRRLGEALRNLGASAGVVRVARGLTAWLLFGYPAVMLATVLVTIGGGRASLPSFEGPFASALLVVPFFLAALVLLQALPYCAVIEGVAVLVRRRRGAGAAARFRAVALVAVVAGLALYTPIRIAVERGALRLRHHDVGRVAGPADAPGPPFRVVFVSDLQRDAHTGAARAARTVALANAAGADVVLAGGDWINTGPDHIDEAAASAGALRSRLGTFSVRGDHEYFAYLDRGRSLHEVEQALTRRGVAMIHDEVRWFDHHGRRVGVAFLEHNYLRRISAATIDALLAELAGADYAIVVTHQLDDRVAARLRGKVDLILAGHTHGGQVNPLIGVVHVPLARLETRFVDGRYSLGTTTVIVSAGIGNSLVPFRYASPASLEVIDVAIPASAGPTAPSP